jgi:MFS family permease
MHDLAGGKPGSMTAMQGRTTTLWLMGAMAVVSYIDRQAFTVLMEPIRQEMDLSDSVLALLSGLAFAIFYATFAFPLARIADRGDRATLIAMCVGFWSVATAASGLAQNAVQLAAARIAVASGEAGAGPAAQALLTEIYPKERRVFALGFLQASYSVGLSAGVALAGILAAFFDWRIVFFLIGLPGVFLALAIARFAIEPRRIGFLAGTARAAAMPVGTVLRTFFGAPPLRWVAILCCTAPVTGLGFLMWAPSFLQRTHGLSIAETGGSLGLVILIGLVAGNLTAGWLGDRLGKDNPRANGYIATGGLLLAFPLALSFALVESVVVALACFLLLKFLMTLWLAPSIALAFAHVPPEMRATTSAVLTMCINLAGVGVGTLLIGIMSDSFSQAYGDQSLRYALAWLSIGLLFAAAAAFMAARTSDPKYHD